MIQVLKRTHWVVKSQLNYSTVEAFPGARPSRTDGMDSQLERNLQPILVEAEYRSVRPDPQLEPGPPH